MDEARISFLWKASQLLPPNHHITNLLKSYYLTSVKQSQGDQLSSSGKSAFSNKNICKRCSARWCDGNFSLHYLPSAVNSSRAKKLVEALNKGEKLFKKQRIRAKWYRKRLSSAVVITCNLCQEKTRLHLQNPKEMLVNPEIEIEETKPKTKSKKKKKDKTAGLKLRNIPNKSLAGQQKTLTDSTKKDKILLPNSIKIKKAREIQKSVKKQTVVPSKTQEKNTLLQLANMLKMNPRPGSSTNERLKNLLK